MMGIWVLFRLCCCEQCYSEHFLNIFFIVHMHESCLGIDLWSRTSKSTLKCFMEMFCMSLKNNSTSLWSKTYSPIFSMNDFRVLCFLYLSTYSFWNWVLMWRRDIILRFSVVYNFWTDLTWRRYLISKLHICMGLFLDFLFHFICQSDY